jgi:hypothetical protein
MVLGFVKIENERWIWYGHVLIKHEKQCAKIESYLTPFAIIKVIFNNFD